MAELSNSSLSLEVAVSFLFSMLLPAVWLCTLVTVLTMVQNTTVILQLTKMKEKCLFAVTVWFCTTVVTLNGSVKVR